MVPILYEKDETTFVSNGLGRLRDCISCVVTEERNGVYECDFEYPMDSEDFPLIQVGRIIGVTHDDTDDIQPFDIVSYEKPIEGVVKFHAVHISYRQSYMTVTGSNINSLADAFTLLETATPSNPFTYETDKDSTGFLASADGIPKTVRSMLGGVEGSILDAYGGEYEWDRFRVILHEARGQYRDFAIRYGVNMVDYEEEVDSSGAFSSAIPYWTDGTDTVLGDKVDLGQSTITGRGETVPLDVSEKFESKPTKAQVEAMALSLMNRDNSALPVQSIHVEFVRLQDMPEYGWLGSLMKCQLCDTIKVIFPDYNSSGQFKIVKTEWDVLSDRYESMELGDLSMSLSEALGISEGLNGGGVSSTWVDSVEDRLVELETLGDVISETGTTSISIANNTWKTLCYIDLPPGRWFLYGRVRFASNATGRRFISISNTDNDDLTSVENNMMAVNGSYTYMTIAAPRTVTATPTQRFYLVAQQSSGSSLTTTLYGLSATKIG